MSESASLLHTTVYAALVGAYCSLRFSFVTVCVNRNANGLLFGLSRLFKLKNIPGNGRDHQGLGFKGFLIIIRVVSATHAANDDYMQLRSALVAQKKWLQDLF